MSGRARQHALKRLSSPSLPSLLTLCCILIRQTHTFTHTHGYCLNNTACVCVEEKRYCCKCKNRLKSGLLEKLGQCGNRSGHIKSTGEYNRPNLLPTSVVKTSTSFVRPSHSFCLDLVSHLSSHIISSRHGGFLSFSLSLLIKYI